MTTKDERLTSIVAQGWTTMFIIFVGNLVMDLAKCTVTGDFTQWGKHLGMAGVHFVLIVMTIYAVMPMLIRSVPDRWFRFVVVGFTAFFILFVAAHELSHLIAGTKPFGLLHALDICHHVVAIGTLVAAIAWARIPTVASTSVQFDSVRPSTGLAT